MKKYQLTPEHREQLKPWADKWIANAMIAEHYTFGIPQMDGFVRPVAGLILRPIFAQLCRKNTAKIMSTK